MSALAVLNEQCDKRGWRLALTGVTHMIDGKASEKLNVPGMLLDGLEVRGVKIAGQRELLVRTAVDGLTVFDLDRSAVQLARLLERQGLLG